MSKSLYESCSVVVFALMLQDRVGRWMLKGRLGIGAFKESRDPLPGG